MSAVIRPARISRTGTRTGSRWGRPSKRARRALGTGAGIVIVAVMLFPLYWMLDASFLRPQDLVSLTPTWFPVHGTLAGYRSVFTSQGGHLLVSLVVALGTVVVTLVIAAPAAYGMAKLRVPGRRLLLFALLVAQMIPGIVMANSFYIAANSLGLLKGDLAGFPNGRRVFDDVATIELRAFAGAVLGLVVPSFTADGAVGVVDFGLTNPADGTDLTARGNEHYLSKFPYLGVPYSGHSNPSQTPVSVTP